MIADLPAADPAPFVTSARYETYFDGVGKRVELAFSEPLVESDVNHSDLVITDRATGEVMRGIRLEGYGGNGQGVTRAEWGGRNILPTGDYRAVLPAASVHDVAGNPMDADFTFDFSVGEQPDNTAPVLVRAAYMDWPEPVQRLRFEFSEDVVSGIDWDALELTNLDRGEILAASALRESPWSATIAEWRAARPLEPARYRAKLPAGAARDRYGNPLAADAVIDFEVTGPGDRTPPTVVRAFLEPTNQYHQVRIEFSEDVHETLDGDDIVVTDLTTGRVLPPHRFSAAASYGPEIATSGAWYPGPPLPHGPYRATLRAGSVADPSGNALAGDYTFEFAVPDEDRQPPLIFTRAFVRGDRPYVEYTFSEDVTESLSADDLTLINLTTGRQLHSANQELEVFESARWPLTARWYVGSALDAGEWTATLGAGAVTDRSDNAVAGGTLNFNFSVSGVIARRLFYNNSAFDGRDPAPTPADDAAIDLEKWALTPGGEATFYNVSSYGKGINGLILDVARLPQGNARGLLPSDFDFGPGVPAPSRITVRRAAGALGSDRVTLTWPDGAIINQWLTVRMLANPVTGLAQTDRFAFGSLVGETGDNPTGLRVNALDLTNVRRNLNTASTVSGPYDFDRDGRVTALDVAAAKRNVGARLAPPVWGPAGPATPAAPPVGATDWLDDDWLDDE